MSRLLRPWRCRAGGRPSVASPSPRSERYTSTQTPWHGTHSRRPLVPCPIVTVHSARGLPSSSDTPSVVSIVTDLHRAHSSVCSSHCATDPHLGEEARNVAAQCQPVCAGRADIGFFTSCGIGLCVELSTAWQVRRPSCGSHAIVHSCTLASSWNRVQRLHWSSIAHICVLRPRTHCTRPPFARAVLRNRPV